MSNSAIATSSTTPAKAKTKKNRLSGSFFRFVLTRFLLIIPTVFILVTIVFFVMRATGDPISAALGGRLTPAELQQRIHAARKRDRAADAGIRTFAILCYATPVFFLGLVLKLIFAVWLNILPASGRSDLNSEMQFTRLVSPTGFYIIDAIQLGDMNVLVDVLRHAVLPAVALGLLTAGVFIRLVRTNVISTYNSGYVEAARSRGVSEKRLLNKHAWRPALIPIITVMGMQIALMLAGAVLTETTFEWKGLGFMLSQYLKARDFVAVQGIVILIAIIVAVVNFLVDVIAALIDPRVRY